MARILLTGAAGFVGRNLLEEASTTDHHWTCIDIAFPESGAAGALKTENVACDLSDPDVIRMVVERAKPEVVVHLAGFTGKGGASGNRSALLAANVSSTWNLLDAIAASGTDGSVPVRFLLASSALVYGNREGPYLESMRPLATDEYAVSKLLAERTVELFATRGIVRPVVLRPAVIYGPGQKGGMFVPSLVESLLEGRRFPMTKGEQKRDLVHVRDVARAVLGLVASKEEGVFNVGTGRGVAMRDIGRILAECAGRPDLLGIGDLPYRDNESWRYSVDASKLSKATGWSAEIALEEGLRRTYETGRRP